MGEMRKNTSSFLIMFFVGLLVTINWINFSNTEAYLNGLTHQADQHRDYDQDGEKDTVHSHHISAINIIKLATPKSESLVIVFPKLISFQKYDFNYQPSFKDAKFDFSIFRPPISA